MINNRFDTLNSRKRVMGFLRPVLQRPVLGTSGVLAPKSIPSIRKSTRDPHIITTQKPFIRRRSNFTHPVPSSDFSDGQQLEDLPPRKGVRLMPPRRKRIVIGITGATGSPYAIRLLQLLRTLNIETHLIMSKWALATLKYEVPSWTESSIRSLATASYTARDMSAPIASGSFQHDGMVIVPCSMKTLAAVRAGFGDDLIARSADVTMKEERRLVMVVRETPLSEVHLGNMLALRRAGATIFPPVPAFYTRPKTLDDVIDQSVGRILDSLGIHVDFFERWDGFQKDEKPERKAASG